MLTDFRYPDFFVVDASGTAPGKRAGRNQAKLIGSRKAEKLLAPDTQLFPDAGCWLPIGMISTLPATAGY